MTLDEWLIVIGAGLLGYAIHIRAYRKGYCAAIHARQRAPFPVVDFTEPVPPTWPARDPRRRTKTQRLYL